MTSLLEQKCFNHGQREAIARCTECRSYFCRECITDHERKLVCSACLDARIDISDQDSFRRSLIKPVFTMAACACLYLMFHFLGQNLLALPDSFHDGSIWSAPGEEN